MAFLETGDLTNWASRPDARDTLPSWVERIIRIGLRGSTDLRILKGLFGGLPGEDGIIRGAEVRDEFKQFVPEGDSIWEFSVQASALAKIKADAKKRMAAGQPAKRTKGKKAARPTINGGPSVSASLIPGGLAPETTTIVFVTPRNIQSKADVVAELTKIAKWKDVRVIDGVALFDWLQLCPTQALEWAGLIHGVDTSGLTTLDTSWANMIGLTDPKLTAEVIIANREQARASLATLLRGEPQHIFVRGDSEFEAQAFVLAALQGDGFTQERAKTLVGLNYSTALQAGRFAPSIFVVGKEARIGTTTALTELRRHHVVVSCGDPLNRRTSAIELERPLRWDFAKALQVSAKLRDDEADRLARECGASVTVFCRRRPSGQSQLPWWALDAAASVLRPLSLIGRWDASNAEDLAFVEAITQSKWDELQRTLLNYIDKDSAPLVREGTVWALCSHVDSFEILAPRLGDVDIKRFVGVVQTVFAPQNPLEPPGDPDDVFTAPKGASELIRQGIAQTLLLLAVRGHFLQPTLSCPIPVANRPNEWRLGSPRELVEVLMMALTILGSYPQLYSSIQNEFCVLVEAAPDPLLEALERWLEGNPEEVSNLLATKRGFLATSSDATELLWALEAVAWSPEYLPRVARILAQLTQRHDPTERGNSNRPLEALTNTLLWWAPQTFAPLADRLTVLGDVVREYSDVGWALLVGLCPTGSMIQSPSNKPRMRDFAPAQHEILTRRLVYEGLVATVQMTFDAAGTNVSRWIQVVRMMSHFPPDLRVEARESVGRLTATKLGADERIKLWEAIRDETARHRTYAKTEWALRPEELALWDELLGRVAPSDAVTKVKWLFDDWMPDLDDELDDAERIQTRIEKRRVEAIGSIIAEEGWQGVIRLAEVAKFPNFVGTSVGSAALQFDVLDQIVKTALTNRKVDVQFVTAVLWTTKTAAPFTSAATSNVALLVAWAIKEEVPASRIAAMLTWLPVSQESWDFIRALGDEIETLFWSNVSPPIEIADTELTARLTDRMIAVGRPGELSDMVAFGKIAISPSDALRLLDAIITNLSSAGDKSVRHPRSLRQFLAYLDARDDIDDVTLAEREVVLVPALGYFHGLDLRLFKVLKTDPSIFVEFICQMYRPATDAGIKAEPDETARNFATRAYQVLASWRNQLNAGERPTRIEATQRVRPFPGEREDGSLNEAELMEWVTRAKKLAKERDRVGPADNEIGHLLAHSPPDVDDKAWPAKAVRAAIEKCYSEKLQSGFLTEQYNKRGVHGVVEGGKEEQAFSDQAKEWAKIVGARWPKTRAILLLLSKSWEADRDRAVEDGKKRRLQERLS